MITALAPLSNYSKTKPRARYRISYSTPWQAGEIVEEVRGRHELVNNLIDIVKANIVFLRVDGTLDEVNQKIQEGFQKRNEAGDALAEATAKYCQRNSLLPDPVIPEPVIPERSMPWTRRRIQKSYAMAQQRAIENHRDRRASMIENLENEMNWATVRLRMAEDDVSSNRSLPRAWCWTRIMDARQEGSLNIDAVLDPYFTRFNEEVTVGELVFEKAKECGVRVEMSAWS